MVRTIITPTDTQILLPISKEYVGKPIEITYLALDELEANDKPNSFAKLWGSMSDETAEKIRNSVEKMRSEWNENI